MSRSKELSRSGISELEGLHRTGKMGRRDFLGRAAALGVTATTATAIQSAVQAAPRRGGGLIQGVRGGATDNSLDGTTLLDTHAINTSWQVRSNLTEILANGDVVGEAAESWEATPDAAVWRFKLRKGVEFHNGKSLEPADVIYSINLHRSRDSRSGAPGAVAGIEHITADGTDTVVFKLKEGNADFPAMLADYHLVIGIDGTKGKEWDLGIGTGPFVLIDYDPGVRALSQRNPNYFKEGRPYFDAIETINIPNSTARVNALKSSQVQVIEQPDFNVVGLLSQVPGVKIKEAGGTRQYTIPMRTDMAPFDNNHVRLALKNGIDREAILETVLRGHGYLGNDHPIGKSQRYFDTDLEQREYDLDKAKFHLRKAGLADLSVRLHSADIFAGATDAAVLYKEHAAPAGIDIEVVKTPTDGYWSDVWMQKPFSMCYWSGRPTSDWMFSIEYYSEASWNDAYWRHARFDKLLLEARAELDTNQRRALYSEMQHIVRDEGGIVIPVFVNWINAMSDKIGTPERIAGNWTLDGDKNTERWWNI